ncbi:ArsR/SmtB family transcription factor [Virgibacillus oceani]
MSNIYRALGDITRRRILHMLKQKAMTQKEIVGEFTISQPAVKKHLKVLLEEQLVKEEIMGKYRIYHLDSNMLWKAYQKMLHDIGDLMDDKLDSLKNFVEKGEDSNGRG